MFLSFLCFVFRLTTEAATQRCSVKNGYLINFAKFTGKHQASGLQLYLKRDSNTFFYRTPPDDCFCNKLNSISCGIYLSFRSRHLELFCKIIIQVFFTGIFLGLWSRGPSCNFTEQLFFLAQLWMAASNHLNKSAIKKLDRWKIKK